ncbi:MAG: hypothetical protein U1E10_10285 [Bdellovibrionales bacterium]|nr:hypothetical protein [Bdellovibrionales bacterium]
MNTKSPITPVTKNESFDPNHANEPVTAQKAKKETFDILIAKGFETTGVSGASEKRTTWHKVGKAWKTKSGSSLSLELFLLPNQRLVIPMEKEALSDHAGS